MNPLAVAQALTAVCDEMKKDTNAIRAQNAAVGSLLIEIRDSLKRIEELFKQEAQDNETENPK